MKNKTEILRKRFEFFAAHAAFMNSRFLLIPVVFKGIVHFEIKMWYLSAYPKGIQDVGVFFLQ